MKWKSKKKNNDFDSAKKIITDSMKKKKQEKKEAKDKIKKEATELKINKKELKLEIKNIKLDYKQSKKEIPKKPKDEYQKLLFDLREKTYVMIEEKKEIIYDLEFNFGKKHNTIIWNLKKWARGVGKEFRRIIWAPPLLTIKYLGIVILIVGILSAIFTAILYITELL